MTLRTLLLATLLAAMAAPLGYAGDDGETIEQANDTIKAIAKARKDGDSDALGAAFVRVVELHNGLEGDSMRKKLQVAVGSVLKSKKAKAFHNEALSTLEQLDDGDGVLLQLKPKLPSNGDAKVDAHGLYAIQIVGSVRSRKGIKYLAGLAEKGKSMEARVAAATSLGKYRDLEQGRVDALEALLHLLHKLKPVEGKEPSETAAKAWAALEAPIVAALDELTFKELKTTEAWVEWHASNKGKLKSVFDD